MVKALPERTCIKRIFILEAPDISKLFLPMPVLPVEYQALAEKSERDMLGLLLLWGDVNLVADIEPSWFTTHRNLIIFYGITAAADAQNTCDVVTVAEELEMAGRLEEIGGLLHLAELARESPNLRTWQLSPLLKGYSLMRYAMGIKNGERTIVRLEDALLHGWLHGKSWFTSGAQLKAKSSQCFVELSEDDYEWVCYAFLNEEELHRMTSHDGNMP